MGLFSIFKTKQKSVSVPIEDIPMVLLNTFEEYRKRLSAELFQTRVANNNIQVEVSIFCTQLLIFLQRYLLLIMLQHLT